jgi:hypothetical protein
LAIEKKTCANHPDRPAIGVCVITRKAICAECSTRYEGVNYSKEGLRILQARRASQAKRAGSKGGILAWGAALLSPLFLFLLYAFYLWVSRGLANILHAPG